MIEASLLRYSWILYDAMNYDYESAYIIGNKASDRSLFVIQPRRDEFLYILLLIIYIDNFQQDAFFNCNWLPLHAPICDFNGSSPKTRIENFRSIHVGYISTGSIGDTDNKNFTSTRYTRHRQCCRCICCSYWFD